MSSLLAIRGPNIGLKYSLDRDVTTLGRAPECSIALADSGVSRVHCEIRRRGRSYTIHDTGSKNGLLVNGKAVEEKRLLRNDQIALGAGVFLFDSDFDLKNTRFSNKLVYFSAPQDETMQARPVGESDEREIDGAQAIQGLASMADLFAAEYEDLPAALEDALSSVMRLFNAEAGCIMLWDEVTQELQPMVADADAEQLAVSRQLVQTVFREKQAVLTSNVEIDFRYAPEDNTNGARHSVMCVPLMVRDDVIGLMHLERLKLDAFQLGDVRLLQSVANLAAAAIEQAQRRSTPKPEPQSVAPDRPKLIGGAPAFLKLLKQVDRVAPYDSAVLIQGETGAGKEMIARTLHERSPRARYPFVAVNCAAIPEALVESELFGYERGAFTGAARMTIGKIEAAHGGTLFLDEIGEMALSAQPKLLRFLQDKAFYRVGGTKAQTVDVRVIAATNADLSASVRNGAFREDLFYRLNVVTLDLPPLRKRREDIRLLVEHFARKHSQKLGRRMLGITDEAIVKLEGYPWPGNVRELENCVERAVLLSDSGVLDPRHFSPNGARDPETPLPLAGQRMAENDGEPISLRQMEERMIRAALERTGGNQARAAETLDIHRNTIRNKIKEYGINLAAYADD